VSAGFRYRLCFPGIESSIPFVPEPEGNVCIERFFRIFKEQLLWVRDITKLEDLAQTLV